MTESRGSTDTREEQPGPAAAKKQGPVCHQLHEAGHLATECSAKELRKTELRSDFPLSPTIVNCVSDGMYEGGTVARAGDAALPLIGLKRTVDVFGRKWMGLLDRGSEISIIS